MPLTAAESIPRLRKKARLVVPPVPAPSKRTKPKHPEERYERKRLRRLRWFERFLSKLELSDPALIPRHAELRDRYRRQVIQGLPFMGPPIKSRHRRWILSADPTLGALELFRCAFLQKAPSVEWTAE